MFGKVKFGVFEVIRLLILFFFIGGINCEAKISLSKRSIQGKLNIVNGASAECVMHYFYTSSGWKKLDGEIGRNGIDGLYVKLKKGQVSDVLVSESKWNKSKLGFSGKGKTIKQMSKRWILRTLDKLIKYKPSRIYSTIRNFVNNNAYRARLFRLKPIGKNKLLISIFSIKNKGMDVFSEIKERDLPAIDINNPSNSFQSDLIRKYNDCRIFYLRKYLGFLSNEDLKYLIRLNNIMAADVSN